MKRTLSLVLALVMVLGSFSTVFAAEVNVEKEAGELLKQLGVLVGDASGNLMLEEGLKRQDAVILLSKLMGEFDEAAATEGSPSYKDIADKFYVPFLVWAQANETFVGHSDAKFGFNDNLTTQEFARVLLVVLGYGEVKWDDTLAKAKELGLVANVDTDATFVRGTMAVMTQNALGTKVNGSEKTLAEELEIEMPAPAVPAKLEVKEIKANSARSFEVTFNKAVADEDKVTFEVKRGSTVVSATPVWNDEKTVATLTTAANLVTGKYVVTVLSDSETLVSKEIEITGQRLASVEFTSTVVAVVQNTSAGAQRGYATFVARDQYGNDISSTHHASNIQWVVGGATATAKDGILTIVPAATTNLITLQQIAISGFDSNTGVTVNVTLPTSLAVGTLSKFEIQPTEDLVVTAGDIAKVHYIPFKAYDLSGNETKNYDQIVQGLVQGEDLIVSNNDIEAKIVRDPANAINAVLAVRATGTANVIVEMPFTITAMTFTGHSSSMQGKMIKAAELESLVLFAPDQVVAVQEYAVIPFEAFDQNGNRITRYEDIVPYVSIPGTTFFKQSDGTLRIESDIRFAAKTTVTYTAVVTRTGKFSTTSFAVQDRAVAERILLNTSAFAPVIEHNGTAAVTQVASLGSVTSGRRVTVRVVDQYGRDMNMVTGANRPATDTPGTLPYVVRVESSGVATGTGTLTNGLSSLNLSANAPGSGSYTFRLYNNATDATNPAVAPVSTAVLSVTAIRTSDIVDYTVTQPTAPIYAKTSATGYNQAFSVSGKTATGATVALYSDSIYNPIHSINVENTVEFEAVQPNQVKGLDPLTANAPGASTKVTVNVQHNNRFVQLPSSLTSSVVPPAATAIGYSVGASDILAGNATWSRNELRVSQATFQALTNVSQLPGGYWVEDSYGKYVMSPAQYSVSESKVNNAVINNAVTVNRATGAISGVAGAGNGDYFVLTGVTHNGLSVTIKVIVDITLTANPLTNASNAAVQAVADAANANDVVALRSALQSPFFTGFVSEYANMYVVTAAFGAVTSVTDVNAALKVQNQAQVASKVNTAATTGTLSEFTAALAKVNTYATNPVDLKYVATNASFYWANKVDYIAPANFAAIETLLSDSNDVLAAKAALTSASLTIVDADVDPVVVNALATANGVTFFITAATDTEVTTTGAGVAATSVSIARHSANAGQAVLTLTMNKGAATATQTFTVAVPEVGANPITATITID